MEAGFAIQHNMHTLVSSGRKPPLGGVTARPSQHHFAGRITAPDLLVERTVEPAIVAAFQGVHDHEGDTASVFTFIPWLATFLLAPTGALGLASVPHTATGVRVGVTFAPTLLAFVRGRRWRRFPGIHLRRDTYIPQRFHASKATPYSGEHSRGFRAMARVC